MLKQVLSKCYNKMTLYKEEESNLELGILQVNYNSLSKLNFGGFPGGAVVENLPANAGDTGSSPGLGGSHMPRSN